MGLAAQSVYSVVEHLGVEIKADGGDLARLVLAQHLARAAYLQVVDRHLETGSKLGKLL